MTSNDRCFDEVSFFNYNRVFEPIRDDIRRKFDDIIDSGIFINGPDVGEFEKRMSVRQGRSFIACSSGTDALGIALRVVQTRTKRKEVLVPSFTFVASAMSATNLGFDVKFLDVAAGKYHPDVDNVISNVTSGTAAIIWPHLFGFTEDLTNLREFCDSSGVILIEDCAQSLESRSEYGGKSGTFGHFSTFSFFPAKNLGAFGDAGGISACEEDLSLIRDIISHGCELKYSPYTLGGNYRMDTLQAGVLNVLLATLDSQIISRKNNAMIYASKIKSNWLELPKNSLGAAWNQFTITSSSRESLVDHLNKEGIASKIYYPIPLHRTELYNDGLNLVNTEKLCQEVLSLPIYPGLSNLEIERVISVVNSFDGELC